MKKNVTLIAFICLMLSYHANSQVVPTAGLEVWNNIILYEDPANWSSPNQLTSILGITPVTKSTDAASGTYAAKLVGAYIDQFQLTVPGAIGTGTIDATTQSFKGGFPLNGNNPQALIGYYKYAPVSTDSCLIFSVLFHWDAVNSKRDTTAIAFYSSGVVENYTLFSAPFIPLSGETPDSAIIIISTSKDILTAQAGSTMYVDDIDLSNAVGVSETPVVAVKMYPNPADETISFQIPNEWNVKEVEVVNVGGTLVKTFAASAGDFTMGIKQFAPGLYLCQLKDQSGKVVASGKFSVKH